MMWVVWDAEGTIHLGYDGTRLGGALCGYPPVRASTGEQWKMSDPGIKDAEPCLSLEEVSCVYCKHAVDLSQVRVP